MQSSLFLLITIFSFSFYYSLNSQTDSLKASQYYQQAEIFLLKGKPEKAIKLFRRALTSNEKLTAAWRALGASYELLEKYDSTILHYQKVISLNPNFSRVLYFELGRAYYRNGQYQNGLNYFDQFEKLQVKSINIFGFNGEKEQQFEIEYLENLPRSIRECKNALALLNFSNVRYIQNLGDSINTANDEYFPYLSNDKKLLFYTSSIYNNRLKVATNENLNYAYLKENWQKGQHINHWITSPKNEGMSTFTRDGVMMIYTVCEQEGVLANGCDLREAIMSKDSIISIHELEGMVNSEFWESQAALSCDGNQLFFASNRKRGLGLTDIWVSQRLSDCNWGKPKNLGNNINTKGFEEAPFITNDGKTLFFSSTGHLGMGEQDIFMSHWNEKGYWGPAINLGVPINTAARELGFFLTSDNQTGFFASDRQDGFGGTDIYQFEIPNQFEVKPTTFVEGFVKDSITKAPLQVDLITNLRGNVKTDKNGRFFFCLPANQNLAIKIEKNNYLPKKIVKKIPEWDNQSLFPINIYLQPKPILPSIIPVVSTPKIDTVTKTPKPVFIKVHFDFNDFGLNPTATKILDKLVSSIDESSFSKVEIIGFADTSGDSEYNLDLSKKRAANVAKYLNLNGISSKELIVLGIGEDNQFDKNRLNRRVEIRLQ